MASRSHARRFTGRLRCKTAYFMVDLRQETQIQKRIG